MAAPGNAAVGAPEHLDRPFRIGFGTPHVYRLSELRDDFARPAGFEQLPVEKENFSALRTQGCEARQTAQNS